jgi:probable rRNA maturation factor
MLTLLDRHGGARIRRHDLRRLVKNIAADAGQRWQIQLILVNDLESRRWNRRALRHDWSTDVISLQYAAGEGEVVVNVDRARREAKRRGHTTAEEVLFLTAHGFLHLLGYDDHTPRARARMLAEQSRQLARLGYEVR